MLIDNNENKVIEINSNPKLEKLKQNAKEEIDTMQLKNEIAINKIIEQNKLEMAKHETSITQPTKKSSKLFGIFILVICTALFVGSTLATLVSGLEAYLKVSLMAGIGFGLIMAGVPTFLYIMALCNNKIKNDFRRFLPFYNFVSNVVLIISITFNFKFLYAMQLHPFYSIILFLTCVILDMCWFFGIQYAVSLLTYRTDDTQKNLKTSITEMILDNLFFKIKQKVQDKYQTNHGIKTQENNKNQSKTNSKNTEKDLQESSQENNQKTLQEKNLKTLESQGIDKIQNSQESCKKKDEKTNKDNTTKSRKKSSSGSRSSGNKKSQKTDYEKAILYMQNQLPENEKTCKITVGELKKTCKITDHNWLQKIRPELIKNDIIENHPKDTIYKKHTLGT